MKLLQSIIDHAYSEKRMPFSLSSSLGEINWKVIQKRNNDGNKEIAYESEDGKLSALLVLCFDEGSSMLSLSIRLFAHKSLPYTLNQIKIADLQIPSLGSGTKLLTCTGGFSRPVGPFPPPMLRDAVYDIGEGASKTILSNLTGRSSEEELPIWVAQIDNENGIWYGPEWSGSWEMIIGREKSAAFISLNLPTMNFKMIQGEEIDLPGFLIGDYTGDLAVGSNTLRRVIKEKLTPKINGRVIGPQVIFQGMDGLDTYQDEKYLIREAKIAAAIGVENFVLDAGWNYAPNERIKDADGKDTEGLKPWWQNLGNWTASKERFPSGMEHFGALAKSLGMRFGTWCEPRVSPGKNDALEYRDVLLDYNKDYLHPVNPLFFLQYLVDLGKKRGEDYFISIVERLVEEYGVNWFFLDFNAKPRPIYWDDIEEPDRRGIMELRWYRGLYRLLDRLMKKYPDLWIESCASGGRILDLGMMRRSHSMWVTDFTGFEDGHQDGDVDMCRNVRSGISKFIPSVYIQNGIHVPRAIRNAGEIYPLYNYLSHFAGDLQFGQGLPDWKEEDIKFATYVTSKYKIYRRYLEEDFYQLVPIPKDKTGWDGWQFDDRKSDSGILILFRMQDCESPSFSVPAKGLAGVSNFTYEVILGDGLIGIKDGILVAELKNRRDSMLVYYSRKEDL